MRRLKLKFTSNYFFNSETFTRQFSTNHVKNDLPGCSFSTVRPPGNPEGLFKSISVITYPPRRDEELVCKTGTSMEAIQDKINVMVYGNGTLYLVIFSHFWFLSARYFFSYFCKGIYSSLHCPPLSKQCSKKVKLILETNHTNCLSVQFRGSGKIIKAAMGRIWILRQKNITLRYVSSSLIIHRSYYQSSWN